MSLFSQQPIAQTINNPVLGPNLQGLSGEEFIGKLLPAFVGLGFLIGTIVFFFILLIGAIQWITSGGDKTQTEAARSKVTNAIVGVFILFSLYAIINLIEIFFKISILQIDLGVLKL